MKLQKHGFPGKHYMLNKKVEKALHFASEIHNYPNDMEARFHHRIKKNTKHNSDLLSHNSDYSSHNYEI